MLPCCNLQVEAQFIIFALCIFTTVLSTVFSIMIPKFKLIWDGTEVNVSTLVGGQGGGRNDASRKSTVSGGAMTVKMEDGTQTQVHLRRETPEFTAEGPHHWNQSCKHVPSVLTNLS